MASFDQYLLVDANDPNPDNGVQDFFTPQFLQAQQTMIKGIQVDWKKDENPAIFNKDIPVTGAGTMYRLKEGIERFFITDINNPAGSSMAQSSIIVSFDKLHKKAQFFNHVPGGGNVLFLDGHVEYVKYPSKMPMTVAHAVLRSGG